MKKQRFINLNPNEVSVDHRYQRELDINRVNSMIKSFDPRRVGVPVVSKRLDGSYWALDAQHRLAAIKGAGFGDESILMEVHHGLSLAEEAAMFLLLNKDRTAVKVIYKFKARLEAKEPIALEIQSILKRVGCKISRSPQPGGVMAVQAVECAHRAGNLEKTMRILFAWLDGDSEAFHEKLIRAMSAFLVEAPEADEAHLIKRLEEYAPAKMIAKLKREQQQTASTADEAAWFVFSGIYNYRTIKAKRVGVG